MSQINMGVGGSTPPAPSSNEVSLYVKADKRFYMQDDTGAEVKLLTNESTLASLAVQAPLLSTGGSSPTLSVSPVTTLANGIMLASDKVKLNNSTIASVGNTLVLRDASGSFTANEITASSFIGTASSVVTIPSLSGAITSTGLSNLTSLGLGVVTNAAISNTAGIALSKLAVDPLNRSNHTGLQSAATLSNLGTEINSHLTSTAPITDDMINSNADIAISKLAVNPLARGNHTGSQLASSISNFDSAVENSIDDYLTSTPLTDSSIAAGAGITLDKLAVDPLARANHTGTQPSSTIANFTNSVAAALDPGNGISISNIGLVSAVGTPDRISAGVAGIDIAFNYIGQPSITTVGTINSGTWNGGIIPVGFGGTGASSAGGAANKLIAVTSVNSSITLNNTNGVILVDATSGAQTITLPLASTPYKFIIKKIDSTANNVTIAVSAGNTIEGTTTRTLATQYATLTFVSNGTTWYLV